MMFERDTDHFVLGDGALACIVEWNHRSDREPYGLLIGPPGRLARKESTLLWHPEHRLRRTMITAIVDGVRHAPEHASTVVQWTSNGLSITWTAGDVRVEERLSVGEAGLRRIVYATTVRPCELRFEVALYANPSLFLSFETTAQQLRADGLDKIRIAERGECTTFERFLKTNARECEPAHGTAQHMRLLYQIGSARRPDERALERYFDGDEPTATSTTFGASSDASPVHQLYLHSRRGLRAAVSFDGRFNASLFQYEFEWGMDAAMAASAAVVAGDWQLAARILDNILTRLSNDEGMIVEAGRFRAGPLAELNGNGAVLDAVAKYWRYTRDDDFIDTHWKRIVAIAEFPLREEFQHESGLLRTRRDFWERYPWQGVGDGFEIGHQVFCSVGLAAIAEVADEHEDHESATRWLAAALRIRRAMLEHPTHSLVESGRFIRRRLVDGSHETALIADPSWRDDRYAQYLPPQYDTRPRPCEPDVTEVLPIIYGIVDARSNIARQTLDAVASLWSPNDTGGYARYNVASDPDSPGPWPFATAMVAAAELDAGRDERAHRTIDWLIDAAGPGGCWLEYYGERMSPPLPPTGIIVWGWAQYILLCVEHLAGVRVDRNIVRIRPRASGLTLSFRVRAHHMTVTLNGTSSARVNGHTVALVDGELHIALPLTSTNSIVFTDA